MTKDDILMIVKKYNSVFQFEDFNTNILTCEMKSFSLNCLSLDEVEICAYKIIKEIRENKLNCDAFQWKWKNENDKLFFYILPNEINRKKLNIYLEKCKIIFDDFSLYKSCKRDGDNRSHSCPLEVDLLLTINRSGRDLEKFNLLSQILCCLDMNLTLNFLETMREELLKIKDCKTQQKQLYNGIEEFVNGIESVCSDISLLLSPDGLNQLDNDTLSELVKTCNITADVFRKKRQMKKESVYLSAVYSDNYSTSEKMSDLFQKTKEWKRDKKLKRRSCNSVLSSMEKLL